MMKILIVVPSFKLIGGVANHFMGLNNYWKSEIIYSVQGHRNGLHAIFWLIPDYIMFVWKIITKWPDIVMINPSLSWYMTARDGLYLLIAKLFRRKVICMMHGWDIPFSKKIEKHPLLFKLVYERVSLMYVLCSDYKKQLDNIKFSKPVRLNTTKVDDSLLEGFDVNVRYRTFTNILFLARVAKEKGIYVAIDAFAILKTKYPDLIFTIVGNGKDLEASKQYVKSKNIKDVYFTGGLHGKDISEQYSKGDLYILPTYFEGMATSVLEAMAFGLPILTAPVGGVKDFFVEGDMGYLIDTYKAEDYAEKIEYIMNHKNVYNKMVQTNYQYATTHFLASSVAERIENDFKNII